jgi:DNA-binding transcriptional MocR family regulator
MPKQSHLSAHHSEDSRADLLREGIEKLIVTRQFHPGDRLPSERDLAEEFGVSRTVVREAVHSLVARNLLEVKPGSGIVVRLPSRQTVIQLVVPFSLSGFTTRPARVGCSKCRCGDCCLARYHSKPIRPTPFRAWNDLRSC